MSALKVFDAEIVLPDDALGLKQKTLLGFDERYRRIKAQLRLLLSGDELSIWNKKHHGGRLSLCALVSEQYPLVIFHGDVGTGKTANAECMANRLVEESRTGDAVLFKLGNRVRGGGKVGEMGTLISEAFDTVTQAAGKGRRAVMVIDEGDSLAASRAQAHSHHEDKVGVNTLIQCIDELRRHSGRVVVFLCTNRLSTLDPALLRRAAIIEEFTRPTAAERQALFSMDLTAIDITATQVAELVALTGERGNHPAWTYSDIRTRLYPSALALAFPDRALGFDHLLSVVRAMRPSPVMEDI